jgi:Mg2+/Co2+ transporter CorB
MLITILSILGLILVSAFFSGSETGLTGASKAKIHKRRLEGDQRAETVSELREDNDKLIGTILLGNNAVNILATVLASNLALEIYGEDYNEFLLTIVLTLVILIFAEVMPKTYAIENAEKVALRVAPIFKVLVMIFSPVTKLVQLIANGCSHVFAPKKSAYEDEDDMEGADMLRGAIEMHHHEGTVVKDDRDMLGSILDLSDTEVGEVMIHRKDMKAIDIKTENFEIVEYMLSAPYTRIPFWEDNPDNIIGVLHSKFLMRALRGHKGDIEKLDVRALLKGPWFVPENRSLRDQLKAFRVKHNHFAFVVDEYGALQGMLTIEDIIEEIVGQIEEEPNIGDVTNYEIVASDDGSYEMDGQVSIRDVNRALDWALPDEEANTLAGLVIHEAQLIPEEKQVFHFHGCRFEVLKKVRNQVTKLRVSKVREGVQH